MQTLGISDSTPRTENRWQALFWPTIRNDVDYDYVTRQGFWICIFVGAVGLVQSAFSSVALMGAIESVFFLLAGVGVRQRSKAAAIAAFSAYFLGTLVLQRYTGNGFGFLRIVFLALLLANIRGSWQSARWSQEQEQFVLPSFNATVGDWLTYKMPQSLWPKVKSIFYVLIGIEMCMLLALLLVRRG